MIRRYTLTAATLSALVAPLLIGCADEPRNEDPRTAATNPSSTKRPTAERTEGSRSRRTPDAPVPETPDEPAAEPRVADMDLPQLFDHLLVASGAEREAVRKRLAASGERRELAWLELAITRATLLRPREGAEVIAAFGPDAIERLAELCVTAPHGKNAVVKQAFGLLAARGHGDRVVAALTGLAGPGGGARQFAMDALSHCGRPGVEALADLLAGGASDLGRLETWTQRLGGDAAPLIRARIGAADGRLSREDLPAMAHLAGAGGQFVTHVEDLLEREPATASKVAEIVGGLGPAGLPLVVRLTEHESMFVKHTTLNSLKAMGAEGRSLAPTLLARLRRDEDDGIHAQIVGLLVDWGMRSDVLDILRTRAETGALRGNAIFALTAIRPEGPAMVREYWRGWLASTDAPTRAAGLRVAMEVVADDEAFVDAVAELLVDPDPDVVRAAIFALAKARERAATAASALVEAIARLIREGGDRTKSELSSGFLSIAAGLSILAELGPAVRDQQAALAALLDRSDVRIYRRPILQTLVAIGADADELALRELAHPRGLAYLAFELIDEAEGSLRPAVRNALWAVIDGDDVGAAPGAFLSLHNRGAIGGDDVPRLLHCAARRDPRVAIAALERLGHLVPSLADVQPLETPMLRHIERSHPEVRNAAVDVIGRMGSRAAALVEPLLGLVPELPVALRALGGIGAPAVSPVNARLRRIEAARRTELEDEFLRGVRAADHDVRATCRAWIVARYGEFGTDDAPPAGLPEEPSVELRWAIDRATGDE